METRRYFESSGFDYDITIRCMSVDNPIKAKLCCLHVATVHLHWTRRDRCFQELRLSRIRPQHLRAAPYGTCRVTLGFILSTFSRFDARKGLTASFKMSYVFMNAKRLHLLSFFLLVAGVQVCQMECNMSNTHYYDYWCSTMHRTCNQVSRGILLLS